MCFPLQSGGNMSRAWVVSPPGTNGPSKAVPYPHTIGLRMWTRVEAAVSDGKQWKVQVYLSEGERGDIKAWAVLSPGDGTALVGLGCSGGTTPAESESDQADIAAGLALCNLGQRLASIPNSRLISRP